MTQTTYTENLTGSFHDPYVAAVNEHALIERSALTAAALRDADLVADLVAVLTPRSSFDRDHVVA